MTKLFKNKAFSLIELLVAIFILSILLFIGSKFYSQQKRSMYVTWTKSEMSDIYKFMNTAKSYDGHYHQYIYAMGYRPKGKVIASVGTVADHSTICCDKYPDPGESPCAKDGTSGYTYYNCKSGTLHTATDNIEICDDTDYSLSCQKEDGLTALKDTNFVKCRPQPATWCDCNKFTVGAITFFGKELTINDTRTFCE